MSNTTQPSQEASPHIEKLLEAANAASQTVAALHVAFLAFVAYLGVIVWGTTHKDLLLDSPVELPILDVELSLTTFYCFVPWMVILLHFNLLMQLELLSRKLWNLDRDIPDTAAGQQVRDRLFIFPFAHLIAGRSNVPLIRWLLSLVVGVTVIALPLLMLLAAQIRFLPFHDETITWSQRVAVWIDAAMLITLWPLIASPQDKASEWWRSFRFQLFGYWPAWLRNESIIAWNWLTRSIQRYWQNFPPHEIAPRSLVQSGTEPKGMIVLLVSVPLIVLLSIVAVIPGNITVQTYYPQAQNRPQDSQPEETHQHFENWLIHMLPEGWLSVASYKEDDDVVSCTPLSLTLAKKSEAPILQVMLGSCAWFNFDLFPRNLNLRETLLVPKDVPLSLVIRATDPDKLVRDAAFKEFAGLNLQKRDLRFANLFGAVLPKADLRHVELQGAVLKRAKLQGAILLDYFNDPKNTNTELQGVLLSGAELPIAKLFRGSMQGADMSGANLQGVELSWAKLQGADLRGADLQGASLRGAELQGADLRWAKLQGADLSEANFQGANLNAVNFQGSNLRKAKLQGAELQETQLQGSDLSQANLEGLFITKSSFSAWNAQQQERLETILKPILDSDSFNAFQTRLNTYDNALPSAKPADLTKCYSDNPRIADCIYHTQPQMDEYRIKILYPKLIELACTDAAIAKGIARRGYNKSTPNDPNFGLASALLNALLTQNDCTGLTALPELIQQKLRKTAEQQKQTKLTPAA
ncbi:MAG: pentapeptide repeat-containing protein [Methylococcales bacterium]